MSTQSPEQRKQESDTLPPFPTDETVVIPPPANRDDKHETRQDTLVPPTLVPEKKGFSLRAKLGAVAALVATGVGGIVGYNALSGGDKDPQDKRAEQGTQLVLDANGNPVTYVEWDPVEHPDRDGNGKEDNGSDVDKDGIIDSDELYNQETGEFVDPAAGTDEAALEGASETELSQIAEIEAAFPTINEVKPHWKVDFLDCDPLVQKFVVVEANRRGDFETEADWQGAVLYALNLTPDEIKDAAASAE